jgi:hypothetical protein
MLQNIEWGLQILQLLEIFQVKLLVERRCSIKVYCSSELRLGGSGTRHYRGFLFLIVCRRTCLNLWGQERVSRFYMYCPTRKSTFSQSSRDQTLVLPSSYSVDRSFQTIWRKIDLLWILGGHWNIAVKVHIWAHHVTLFLCYIIERILFSHRSSKSLLEVESFLDVVLDLGFL